MNTRLSYHYSLWPTFYAAFLCFFLCACSPGVLITSSAKNPPENETAVGKKSENTSPVLVSASNDAQGILIAIRIQNELDQYKVLKYGALLSVETDKSSRVYSVAYPLENTDKSLRLPVLKNNDDRFNFEPLLNGLSGEASTLAAFQFYGRKNFSGNAAVRDSLSLQVKRDIGLPGQGDHVLAYTAYVPYNSIPDFEKSHNGVNRIKIHFQSAYLNIIGSQGLSRSAVIPNPWYAGYAAYYGPWYSTWRGAWGSSGSWGSYYAGPYWGGLVCRPWLGYVATSYNAPSARYRRRHPDKPVPNTRVLERLTSPIDVWARIQLAR